jgi:hypothetical protein
MAERIFYFEGSDGGFERCLEIEDDGTLTYWTSPNRYAAIAGEKGTYEKAVGLRGETALASLCGRD